MDFVARRVQSVKIGSTTIVLNSADDTDDVDLGTTGDVKILEV
jgi:hypothetical protein